MLRYSEILCLALIAANAAAFLGAWSGSATPARLKVPLLAGFGIFFLLVLVALGHTTPLARARRSNVPEVTEPDGLSATDFKTLLKLAPRFQQLLAAAGLVALGVAAIAFGSVSWSSGMPFDRHHSMGIAAYVASLAAVLCPWIGALSRLPASVEEQVRLLQREDA